MPMDEEMREKLVDACCRAVLEEPWYGSFISGMKFIEDVRYAAFFDEEEKKLIPVLTDDGELINFGCPTMGVSVCHDGIRLIYNPEFVRKHEHRQLRAIVKHEIEHLVRDHPNRMGIFGGNKQLFNIAMDILINGSRENKNIVDLPDSHEECCYMPHQWVNTHINGMSAEELYKKLMNDAKQLGIPIDDEGKCAVCGKTKPGPGNDDSDSICNCPHHGEQGKPGDDHRTWELSDVSEDEMRSIIKDQITHANQAGDAPNHLSEAIAEIMAPKVDWRSELRNFIGRTAGGKRLTYARRSRRYNAFGIKGTSNHASIPMTIFADTSGSISSEQLQQFFAEIESISSHFKITLIQFTVGAHTISTYHKGDWRTIECKDRGGTDIIPAINEAKEEGLLGRVNIVLTDGHLSWPDPTSVIGTHWLWAITTKGMKPPFGDHIDLSKIQS